MALCMKAAAEYEALKKRFEYVTNAPAASGVSAGVREEKAPESKSEEPKNIKGSKPVVEVYDEAEEDTEGYFASLANKD